MSETAETYEDHYALELGERQLIFDALASAIDTSNLSLDEFLFGTSELIKSHFWMQISQGRSDEEVDALRARLMTGINRVADSLEATTESISEDMIILFSVVLEAVNHIFGRLKEQEAAAASEAVE